MNLVNVFFTVTNQRGAWVSNLSKDSFEILEDGKPQTIQYFVAGTDLPMTVGLLIDTSGTMIRTLEAEKAAARDFLRQMITDKDLGFIISFDISVDMLQDLTADSRLLRTGIEKTRINVAGGTGIPGIGQGPIPASHPRGALLFDSVYLAAEEVLSKQAGRKAMVILTNGVDEGSKLNLKDAVEAAQKADAVCYVLVINDPRFGLGMTDAADLAEQTGGRTISVDRPDKIGAAFTQISNDLRSQYTLAYEPVNLHRDGSFHKIEIKMKNSAYYVRARKGYYASKE